MYIIISEEKDFLLVARKFLYSKFVVIFWHLLVFFFLCELITFL